MAAGLYPAEQALITLGAAVGGIAKSYGTAQWFDQILPVELPCLIVIPSTKEAGAWGTSAFLGNAAKHQFGLEHWLLYRQIDATPTDRTTLMPYQEQGGTEMVVRARGNRSIPATYGGSSGPYAVAGRVPQEPEVIVGGRGRPRTRKTGKRIVVGG